MSETGITNIRGKEYQTVALRVAKFRDACPSYALTTSIVSRDPDCVVMQAQIADETGIVKATGHAEEYRAASQINKTSALENCETSAIGRALAAFGFGGTEFATANEVLNAIHQQTNPPANDAKASKKLDGPYTSATALKAAYTALHRDIEGCGDLGGLEGLIADKDIAALIEQIKRDAPNWYHGFPDGPRDNFIPLGDLIANRRQELALADDSIPDFIHEQADKVAAG